MSVIKIKLVQQSIDDLLAYSSSKRWEVENSGFEFQGMHIATDDRSKTMITGARIKADGDPAFSTPWKSADGSFTRINAATIIAISDAVLAHVASCFDKEELIASRIADASVNTFEEIDDAWRG